MIELGARELALSAAALVLNGGLSLLWRLGLGPRLAVAALRAAVQLLVVGLALEWLFERRSAPFVVAMLLAMIAVAALTARGRLERTLPGIGSVIGTSIGASAMLVTLWGTLFVLRIDALEPRYAIPVAGMLIGNALTGVALAADRFLAALDHSRGPIEALLAHGASPAQATLALRREAARAGLVPIQNAMLVAGIVALPGMMTGQILAGAPPTQAVRYQIAILFLIAGATALGVFVTVAFVPRLLFDAEERPCWERLKRVRGHV